MNEELVRAIASLNAERVSYALATVIETRGSVSAKIASRALIDADGRLVSGWVGGGCAESATCKAALECMEKDEATILEIDLDDEVLGAGMPCGGHMRVFVEPVLPRPRLWLMGHGRVSEVLCTLADLMGFDVIINDSAVTRERYPAARRLITDDLEYLQLEPAADDFVVIASQHKGDHESMQRVLASKALYIALIASRKRSSLVLEYLRESGVDGENLARVVAPAGLDLGARTPEEIALCVVSQMVMIRRGGSGRDKKATPRSSTIQDVHPAGRKVA